MSRSVEPFLIGASEAVLLGRTVGEYLDAREDSDKACFFNFITSRLCPFYPVTAPPRCGTLDETEVPGDVEWVAFTDDGDLMRAVEHSAAPWLAELRWGFGASCPESWFFQDVASGRILRFTRDRSAPRWLPELVAELVATHVARNAADDAKFNLTLNAPWGRVQRQAARQGITAALFPRSLLEKISPESLERFTVPLLCRPEADDPKKIEHALEQLAAAPDNNCADFFRLGCKIGQALGCRRYETWFAVMLGADEDDDDFAPCGAKRWRVDISDAVPEILEDPLLDHLSSNAGALLAFEYEAVEGSDDAGDKPTELRKLAKMHFAISTVLGEALSAATRADERRKGRRPRPRLPRSLKMPALTAHSSNDEIRTLLKFYETVFDDQSAFTCPKQIVAGLAFGPEALARRVWPDEFARNGPKPDAGNILDERRRNGNDREARFANVALMLHNTYRNDSIHKFDRFDCTWMEAFVFICCMRQLLDWSEEQGARPSR